MKYIIDCDPGIDDAIALLIISQDKNAEILALSSTFGNTSVDDATKNLLSLNKKLGINAPVYRGSERAIVNKGKDFGYFHGKNGMGNVDLEGTSNLSEEYAWDGIYKHCSEHPNEVTVITLGPVSNLAKAFLKYEDLPGLIKELYIMGGTANNGNEGINGEVNFINDPIAAKIVVNANVKKTIDVLNVNDMISLNKEEYELVSNELSKSLPELSEALAFYNNSQVKAGAPGLVINDAAAMFVTLTDDYETEFLPVDIETYSSLSLGRSIIDRRPYADKEPNAEIVTSINKEKYMETLLNAIASYDLGALNHENI